MSDRLRAAAEAALEVLEWNLERGAWGADIEGITAALRAALAEQSEDWDRVAALEASLREHMAEIHRLRAALDKNQ